MTFPKRSMTVIEHSNIKIKRSPDTIERLEMQESRRLKGRERNSNSHGKKKKLT